MEELSEKDYATNREFIEGIKLFRKKKKEINFIFIREFDSTAKRWHCDCINNPKVCKTSEYSH